ncbi:MAG: helix-turn-helix domain-containing protein [Paludibacteraceae bacterium]
MTKKEDILKDYFTNLVEVMFSKMEVLGMDIIQLRESFNSMSSLHGPERSYSEKETCEILKMSRKTLYSIRLNGDIHFREYKGKIWYSKQDIDEFQMKCRK